MSNHLYDFLSDEQNFHEMITPTIEERQRVKNYRHLNKSNNFLNEKLYCYQHSTNVICKIQHDHKIVKITSMGINICFANEMNEIYKVDSNASGSYQKLNPEMTTITSIYNPPTNIPIKYLLAGYFHLILILENNLIYGHGSSNYGQLGVNSNVDKLKLIDTTNLFKTNRNDEDSQPEITHACCGTYSTIIVLNNKEIWYSGKIANDMKTDFTKLKFNNNANDNVIVKNISVGYGHLLVLTNKNELFVYGDNIYAQLIKDGPSSELTKLVGDLSFLNGSTILDAFAFPLSHLSVIVSNSFDIYIFGYFGTNLGSSLTNQSKISSGKFVLDQSKFKSNNVREIVGVTSFNLNDRKEEDENRNNKFDYNKGEISIYGGFSSMIFVDNLKGNIWLGGMRGSQFTNETFYLKEVDKELFTDAREQVLDVAVGSNVYGVLVGVVNLFDEYMTNNLKRLVDSCCKRIVMNENEDKTPLSDIDFNN